MYIVGAKPFSGNKPVYQEFKHLSFKGKDYPNYCIMILNPSDCCSTIFT